MFLTLPGQNGGEWMLTPEHSPYSVTKSTEQFSDLYLAGKHNCRHLKTCFEHRKCFILKLYKG